MIDTKMHDLACVFSVQLDGRILLHLTIPTGCMTMSWDAERARGFVAEMTRAIALSEAGATTGKVAP